MGHLRDKRCCFWHIGCRWLLLLAAKDRAHGGYRVVYQVAHHRLEQCIFGEVAVVIGLCCLLARRLSQLGRL